MPRGLQGLGFLSATALTAQGHPSARLRLHPCTPPCWYTFCLCHHLQSQFSLYPSLRVPPTQRKKGSREREKGKEKRWVGRQTQHSLWAYGVS